MRDRELVQRVKDATDLLVLVGQAVKLRKQGAAWVGLCPFHSERTPSFQVLADRGFYHCFGCGKHGDAFTWLMEREGLTFPEAMEQLARAAGIDLPKVRERSPAEVDHESRLRAALEAAQAFYMKRLGETAKALDYLKGRGMTEAFCAEAGFGCAPDAWEVLVNHLRSLGFSHELIEQTGLASRSERGSLVDFLRNRLTIPIHDARGRLIAFGGRAFGDEKPKYMNTRETALFSKGQVLFGFHRAKGQLRDGALVVEGYFDVLQLHQEGIHGAVAPLGTALTEGHLQQIGRFTKRLILCFDGDAAGQRAMEKALRLALPAGFDVRLLVLPLEEDPDTWCMKLGAQAFRSWWETRRTGRASSSTVLWRARTSGARPTGWRPCAAWRSSWSTCPRLRSAGSCSRAWRISSRFPSRSWTGPSRRARRPVRSRFRCRRPSPPRWTGCSGPSSTFAGTPPSGPRSRNVRRPGGSP